MKSLEAAQIQARIVRHLLAEGKPCDFTAIRFGAGIFSLARDDVWAALRSLTRARLIRWEKRVEERVYQGFPDVIGGPVFWVDRKDLIGDHDRPAADVGLVVRDWWRDHLTSLTGEGVWP